VCVCVEQEFPLIGINNYYTYICVSGARISFDRD